MRGKAISALVLAPLTLLGCMDGTRLTDPGAPDLALVRNAAVAATHTVQMLDRCDPSTFNAAIGPGTCLATHPGLKFDRFVAQLTRSQTAPAWRNAPSNFTMPFGGTIEAINRGGEVHTFTQVAAFGGGVVPFLNALSGTPTPAPECLAAPPSEYLPPGGEDDESVTQHGTLYYQCCIHPWMRTTVVVR